MQISSGNTPLTFGNTYNSQSCTFTNVIAGSVGSSDGNAADADPYQIGLLEFSDGAVKGQMAGACSGDDWSELFTQAWSGATALALDDPASSAYYGDVSSVTLAAGSEPAISFESAQTWDCSGTSERTVDFAALAASSGTNPMTSCSNLELDRDYIDCWHIMGDNTEPIPDLSGFVYQSDNEDCIGGTVILTSTGTENVYDTSGGVTLTMTGTDTCTATTNEEGCTVACTYSSGLFTITAGPACPPGSCTAVLTPSGAICGNDSCDIAGGEAADNCPADCGVVVESISFADDHNWATQSPANDCLAGVAGNFAFTRNIEDNSEWGIQEEYFSYDLVGTNNLRVDRIVGNACVITFGVTGGPVDACTGVTSCDTSRIAATGCERDGAECAIDIAP